MKKRIIILTLLMLLTIPIVKATTLTQEEIPENSIIIGSYLFTPVPEEGDSPYYNGLLNTRWIMLGASSITASGYTEMNIQYKIDNELWLDYITKELIDVPESLDITYRNGVCIDPSCSGDNYDVKFKKTEYNDEKVIQIPYNGTVKKDSLPTMKNRVGYKFKYWTLTDSEEEYNFDTPITTTIELEPKWEQINYKITYHTNFSEDKTNTIECKYDTNNPDASCKIKNYLDVLSEFNNTGHDFKGWSLVPNYGELYSSDITKEKLEQLLSSGSEINLYARWDNNSYSFKYKDKIVTCTYGEECSLESFTADTKEHYDFKNWYIMDDGKRVDLTEKFINFTTDNKTYELIPEYIPHKYPITYNLEDGTNNITNPLYITVEDISGISLKKPIRTGYDFREWIIESDSSVAWFEADLIKIDATKLAPITVKAKWEANTLTIAFKEQQEDKTYIDIKNEVDEVINNITCSYDKTSECVIPREALPTKAGYTFIGWEYKGYIYNIGSTVTNSELYKDATNEIIMTPKWSKNTKNDIDYDLAGGTFPEGVTPVTSYLKDDIVPLPVPTKIGYTFNGWINITHDEENTETLPSNQLTDVNEDVILKAKWTANKYTITFKYYNPEEKTDKTIDEPIECHYNEPCKFGNHINFFTEKNIPFVGWGENKYTLFYGDNLEVINLTSENDKNIDLYAITSTEYKVSFNPDGGTIVNNKYYMPLSYINLDEIIPVKENHEFSGWIANANPDIVNGIYEITEDTLFTATWHKNKFIISFENAEGDGLDSFIVTEGDNAKINVDDYVPNAPKECEEGFNPADYTFDGWYTTDGNLLTGEQPVTDDLTLVAKWHRNTFVVTLEDGESINKVKVKENKTINLDDYEPTPKNKYTFDGWYSGTEKHEGEITITEDITLTAKWHQSTFTVNFIDTENLSTVEVKETETFNLDDYTPTKEGYSFLGWKNEASESASGEISITKDTTFKALWERTKYTVTFTESDLPEIEVNHGDKINLEDYKPTKTGYNFTGWTKNEVEVTGELTITENTELTAIWEKKPGPVTGS